MRPARFALFSCSIVRTSLRPCRWTFSPNRPVGLKTRIMISRAKVKASEKTETSHVEGRPLMTFSQMPMMKAPITAPGMEPMPPNTAATKAFRPGRAPDGGHDGRDSW